MHKTLLRPFDGSSVQHNVRQRTFGGAQWTLQLDLKSVNAAIHINWGDAVHPKPALPPTACA